MSKPKRHHWWPIAQSRHWTASDGLVFVTKSDGSFFRTNPFNIGVESELYTRLDPNGEKNLDVEEWFAQSIDPLISGILSHFLDLDNRFIVPFRGDLEKVRTVRHLGYRVSNTLEKLRISRDIRRDIATYVAALLVRNPEYLAKLMHFHLDESSSPVDVKIRALDNMLSVHRIYADRIERSQLMLIRSDGNSEFLFPDGGIIVEEPWRFECELPFDIHVPLTPKLALEVLPFPFPVDLTTIGITGATNQGVSRHNRISLGAARRFVFSRRSPPLKFIADNFGKPAPKNIGYRFIDGKLETKFDPSKV